VCLVLGGGRVCGAVSFTAVRARRARHVTGASQLEAGGGVALWFGGSTGYRCKAEAGCEALGVPATALGGRSPRDVYTAIQT
jgi:hypothetical protein